MSEVIARNIGHGQYDMGCEERLVKKTTKIGVKHYLILDEYCGETQMRGGAYRPFVYKVPTDQVDKIARLITNPDEMYDELNYDLGTNEMVLQRDVVCDLIDRGCGLGEQRGWMLEL